jgi:hypothetical protein
LHQFQTKPEQRETETESVEIAPVQQHKRQLRSSVQVTKFKPIFSAREPMDEFWIEREVFPNDSDVEVQTRNKPESEAKGVRGILDDIRVNMARDKKHFDAAVAAQKDIRDRLEKIEANQEQILALLE